MVPVDVEQNCEKVVVVDCYLVVFDVQGVELPDAEGESREGEKEGDCARAEDWVRFFSLLYIRSGEKMV